jgi:hypothetical protein
MVMALKTVLTCVILFKILWMCHMCYRAVECHCYDVNEYGAGGGKQLYAFCAVFYIFASNLNTVNACIQNCFMIDVCSL